METDNKILGNQLVIMSRANLDSLVNELAQNIVAAQTKKVQSECEAYKEVSEQLEISFV